MKKYLILSLVLFISYKGFTQNLVKIRECVIVNGSLKETEAEYNQATGDRTIVVNGVRKNFYDVHPKNGPDYAEGQTWFVNNETVKFNGKPYVKYGLPRILGVTEIMKTGVYKGVGVYREAGTTGVAEVIYIPVRQGCEFQPYQINCGTVSIEKGKSTASEMQFMAKTSGLSGTISYVWTSDAPILKGQGTNSITVNIKNIKAGDGFDLSVTATDANNCPVTGFDGILIEKPAGSSATNSKWGEAERKAFMEDCVKSTGLSAEAGKSYCSCMLEKIIKQYPDPLTVEKELKQDVLLAWAKECLPKQ